jgi:hypothetical protein
MTASFNRTALFVCVLALPVVIFALSAAAKDRPLTQRTILEELSRTYVQQLADGRTQLYYDLLADTSTAQRRLNENPDIQLISIDYRGQPRFYQVENLNAARTISTDDVWPFGGAGFTLSGSTTVAGELGEWDGGGVLTTHREFEGRVTQIDSPAATHYHSTHVAGTMVAVGVTSTARGMSFAAPLHAYDWDNDDGEMATAAAAGMHVSNHSYGFAGGWSQDGDWYWYGDTDISEIEDYGFGFYGAASEVWDEIAYNAPYYTIVKSAGNDRDDTGPGPEEGHYVWGGNDWVWSFVVRDPDGGADHYDCIPWQGCAKNIITVGAVGDLTSGYTTPGAVTMSSFSGWGPTDDGRIKPDIVANGISLYSCDNGHDADYTSLSGTSMSTPNVSGSINLLVQYYETTHEGQTPLASTIKALVIHTADEAGPNPGPDYMFGWGLMNTRSAVELIEADSAQTARIREEPLADGETDEYELVSDGTAPLRVTLAWTDPPGTSPPASLNPSTIMLVNDLDVRLEHQGTATVYEPYVLDPALPAAPAGTGDNIRDNVEQIYLESPAAGTYTVNVSHKGTLAAPQYYSLIGSHRISDCDCAGFGDLDLSGLITPLDVTILVNYVYKQLDSRVQLPDCPGNNGDWDCATGVTPLDVAYCVNYVYKQVGGGPCDPCAP